MTDFEEIQLGDDIFFEKKITPELIDSFARLSGDNNPLHMDTLFAQTVGFHERVAHGMLIASYVSTIIGTQLPGAGALWTQQTFRWRAPVFVNDVVQIKLTVVHKSIGTRALTVKVLAVNQLNTIVLDGEGVVIMLEKKEKPADEKLLEDRVALVTGASRGIGAATAKLLAKSGMKIVVNFASNNVLAEQVCSEINAQGGDAFALQADVTDLSAVDKMVKQASRIFGKPINILINNASGSISPCGFMELDWLGIQAHLDVQLKGAFNTCKAIIPNMVSQKFGCIINIGSTASWETPPLNWTSYVIAKSALYAMTRSLALEFGPMGIRVNTISPGMTETDLIADIPERLKKVQALQTPLRRLAVPEDIAQMVLFLCSDAGKYITGADIPVAGGKVM